MALSAIAVVQSDLSKIYLGNLSTVDSDIGLPNTGELGSSFAWVSRHTSFISHEGRVTRPTYGVGNRVVELVVTASYAGHSKARVFEVNVLEEEYTAKIVKAFPVEISTRLGQCPELPCIVVVQNNLGDYTVAPVQWDSINSNALWQTKQATIWGCLEGCAVPAVAVVKVVDEGWGVVPQVVRSGQVRFFSPHEVSLINGSPFAQARDRSVEFLLGVDDDQMLYSFRVASGLDTKGASAMTGWDSPTCNLRGHTTGHYLSALALAQGVTGNGRLKQKLASVVDELGLCQEALSKLYNQGFLSAYSEEQFNKLEQYTTYPTIWAPYYTLHKIMAGLRDSYLFAHNAEALEIYKKLGDWVYRRLSRLPRQQLDKMWSLYIAGEFGGMNEVLADLYLITGKEEYLSAAKLFDNLKLFLPMEQNLDTLGTLHANQHIPQIIGAIRLFRATGEERYYSIASNFWQMATNHHIYSIGGTGETEMFRQPNEIASRLTHKTAESCASYNMIKLSGELFTHNPKANYMDYAERAMYNHILSSQDTSGPTGGTTYFMPLAPGSRKSFDTLENTCCHGTGLESQLKHQELLYAQGWNCLYVNMYIPSRLDWSEKGIELLLTCRGEEEGKYSMQVLGKGGFALKLRKPHWADTFVIAVDGTFARPPLVNGYYCLEHEWNNTIITIDAPYSLRMERSPDIPELCSLFYGPYVLVALSEEQHYLTIAAEGKQLTDLLQQTRPREFVYGDLRFVPLAEVNHEAYHAYFQIL